MAHYVFRGDAPLVAQESRATPANVAIGNTFTLTVNGKSITFTATANTVANVTAGLAALWAASTEGEFTEVTATDQTTYLQLVGPDGIPVTITSSATGGTASLTMSTPTVASGPECFLAANFRNVATGANALPGAADTIWFQDTSVSLRYFLDQSGIGTLTQIYQEASFTGEIGLPLVNANGNYNEYRQRFLSIRASNLRVGNGLGQGSGRSMYDLGSVQSAVLVFTTFTPTDQDALALQVLGTHASNSLVVRGGSVDLARGVNELCTYLTIDVTGDAILRASSGVTHGTIRGSGNAQVLINAAVTTLTTADNCVVRKGNGAVTTAQIYGQLLEVQGSGTITTLTLGPGKLLDASNNTVGFTITNATIGEAASINDDNGKITWTNALIYAGALQTLAYRTRQNLNLQVTYN